MGRYLYLQGLSEMAHGRSSTFLESAFYGMLRVFLRFLTFNIHAFTERRSVD